MNLALRICNHFDQGIGHVMRMNHLAKALLTYCTKIVFLLDKPDSFSTKLLNHYTIEYVYSNTVPYAIDQQHDAALTNDLLIKHQISHLIIDSYQLHQPFESQVRKSKAQLIVFDDLLLPHDCDVLVDYKWQGNATYNRYKKLVPDNCLRLLGPDFCLLDAKYSLCRRMTGLKKKILFSLGGGGDLSLFSDLFLVAKKQGLLTDVIFLVVVGPRAENVEQLQKLSLSHSQVQLITEQISLVDIYLQCDLYVGTVGTALYELACLQMPAITFSISKNQQYNIKALEDFGHYLHFNQLKRSKLPEFAALLALAYQNIERLIALRQSALITIDGMGAQRIAQAICSKDSFSFKPKHYSKHYELVECLGNDLYFCQVNDGLINHYLHSRNLQCNRVRMVTPEKIAPIDHYRWWLQQKREHVLLVRKVGNHIEPLLYIWHALYQETYLYSGWFVCKKNIDLKMLAVGVQAHKSLVYRSHPNTIWLAVCQKSNKFVHLLNQRIGFIANTSEELRKVSKELFATLCEDEYDFIYQVTPGCT